MKRIIVSLLTLCVLTTRLLAETPAGDDKVPVLMRVQNGQLFIDVDSRAEGKRLWVSHDRIHWALVATIAAGQRTVPIPDGTWTASSYYVVAITEPRAPWLKIEKAKDGKATALITWNSPFTGGVLEVASAINGRWTKIADAPGFSGSQSFTGGSKVFFRYRTP